jgi:RimJ/RimL family protein N-acetyltransferase
MSDLVTERLVLHPMTVGEAERVVAGEPGSGDRWAPGYPTDGDVFAARRFLGTCAATGDPQPFGNYEIRRREDGRAIGGVGFHNPVDANGSVTIGYGIVPSAQGQGYASEALRGLLLFARAQGVTCVKGDADHDNIASHRVMLAAGMRPAGQDERVGYFEMTWTEAPPMSELSWYGVRCVFRDRELGVYEERVTLWRAASFDEAIERGESEAREYCADLDSVEYTDFAEAYRMYDEPGEGAEVFSLMRESELPVGEYVERFFDTGAERRGRGDAG